MQIGAATTASGRATGVDVQHEQNSGSEQGSRKRLREGSMGESAEEGRAAKVARTASDPTLNVAHNRSSLALATVCVHVGSEPDPVSGAVIAPRSVSTTFAQTKPGVPVGPYDYTRGGNPTQTRLESLLAALEGAKFGLTFSSGLAAENALATALLEPGDRTIVCDDVYGGTGRLFRQLHTNSDKSFDFVDLTEPSNLSAALQRATDEGKSVKMIWVETPTNPTLKVIDIQAISDIAKEYGAITVVDNTFATPVFQQPLKEGADVVIHSATKYLGGHSDILAGAVMTNDNSIHEKIRGIQFKAGAVLSPRDGDELHRSIKTLKVRMAQHKANAEQLYQYLSKHPKIERVAYPGISGMISFWLKGGEAEVETFLDNLNLIVLAESLGGVESIINHPANMTHASVPEADRERLGIGPNLLRLSVGIEDANDLQADIAHALAANDLNAD